MHGLEPFDTTRDLGYITTLAIFYLPSEAVGQLITDVSIPVARIYDNPNASVKSLMAMINPTIPVIAGGSLEQAGTGSGQGNTQATTTAAAGAGAPIGGDAGTSQPLNTGGIVIGLSAAAGAALYGAAMVFVARRYRARNSRHQRASSLTSAPSPRSRGFTSGTFTQAGGVFMSGGRAPGSTRYSPAGRYSQGSRTSGGSSNGRSVRTQQISAPVMSENSLGWN